MRYAKLALALPILVGLSASQAHANLVITPTFGTTITSDPNAAAIESTINSAISVYEADFSNPITVNIDFEEGGGLGESATYGGPISYATFRTDLIADKALGTDSTAFETYLGTGAGNPVNGNTNIYLTTANARAIGYALTPPAGAPDSTITLNTAITNYNGVPYDANNYPLFAVASHEMDEVLGIGSGLNGVSAGSNTLADPPHVSDLFRYNGSGSRSYTTSTTEQAYFSVNGGQTAVLDQYGNPVYFNQSGGGADFNDWASSTNARVQDAFGTQGSNPTLGNAELTELRDIGYNSTSNISAAPEPSQWAGMGFTAFGALGLILKARKRKVADKSA